MNTRYPPSLDCYDESGQCQHAIGQGIVLPMLNLGCPADWPALCNSGPMTAGLHPGVLAHMSLKTTSMPLSTGDASHHSPMLDLPYRAVYVIFSC